MISLVGCSLFGCSSSSKNTNTASGGQSNTGGSTASGGTKSDAGSPDGSVGGQQCTPGKIAKMEDGGLVDIGATDPLDSMPLQEGGYYAMPSSTYGGYCFTYSDSIDGNTGTSTVYPPCGTSSICFTQASGLCPVANLGPSNSNNWGAESAAISVRQRPPQLPQVLLLLTCQLLTRQA